MTTEGNSKTQSERLTSIETNMEAMSNSFSRFIDVAEKRFEAVESRHEGVERRINEPFPLMQLAGVTFAGLALVVALFASAMSPLFTDTERNRLALIESAEVQATRAGAVADLETIKKDIILSRERLALLSERERENRERLVRLEAKLPQ